MIRSYFYSALSLACVAGLTATLIVMSQESTTNPSEVSITPIGTPLPQTPVETMVKNPQNGQPMKVVVLGYAPADPKSGKFRVRTATGEETIMRLHKDNCKDLAKLEAAFPTVYDVGFYPPFETTLMLDNAKSTKEPATKKPESTKIKVLALSGMHITGILEGSDQKEKIWLGAMPFEDKIKVMAAFPGQSTPQMREATARRFDAPKPLTREQEIANAAAEKGELKLKLEQARNACREEWAFHANNKTYTSVKELYQLIASPDMFPKLHELEYAQEDWEKKYEQNIHWYTLYKDKNVEPVRWWTLAPKIKMKSETEPEVVSLRPEFEKMGIKVLQQTPNGCQLYSGYYLANYLIQKDGGKPVSFATYEAAAVKAFQQNMGWKPNPKENGFSFRDVTGAIFLLHGKKLKAALPHQVNTIPAEVLRGFAEQSLRNGVPVPIVGPSLDGARPHFHAALLVGFRHEPGQKTIYEYLDTQGLKNLKTQKSDQGYFEADSFNIDALVWFE